MGPMVIGLWRPIHISIHLSYGHGTYMYVYLHGHGTNMYVYLHGHGTWQSPGHPWLPAGCVLPRSAGTQKMLPS